MSEITRDQTIVRATNVRWVIVALLFVITAVNYADRATLSITGPVITKQLGIGPLDMGFVFSAFGWSYVLAQLPGGWLLDRFGSKRVYFWSLLLWSLLTMVQGTVGFLAGATAVAALFGLRFLLGAAESPSFPGSARVVAAWFPRAERATATAIFNSAQYFATVIFAPLMAAITTGFGWPWVFVVMGALGLALAAVWRAVVSSPAQHRRVNQAELALIREGGGLADLDTPGSVQMRQVKARDVTQLFRSRMMVGMFIGQYCINALTYFFITWFPVYLVQARGMSILKAGFVASLPAICGFAGGLLGGVASDWMLRRGFSLSAARKTPIVLGMMTAVSMIACNYTQSQWLVVALMALAFFGKGIGALGWAVLADAAPREITGLAGGVFNMCGNLSSITTPIVIGYIIQETGSFNGALSFIAANAVLAAVSYLVIVGPIERLKLR